MSTVVFAVFFTFVSCLAYRSPYAGRSPIGYPDITTSSTTTTVDLLSIRLSDSSSFTSTTTAPTPIEVQGDVDLYNRLLKLPIENQPFWLINRQALDTYRRTPQTYFQKGNTFIDANNVRTL